MKTAILMGVLAALVIVGVALVFLYNTQEFNVNINFKSEIDYSQIEVRFDDDRGKPIYQELGGRQIIPQEMIYQKVLSFAKVGIGNIELENNGYFAQKYLKPEYIACLVFKESQSSIKLNVESGSKISSYENQHYSSYYGREEYIEIKVGEKRQIDFYVTFTERYLNLAEESFRKENLDRIDLYENKKRENNPLSPYNSRYYYQDCNYLTNSVEADFSIRII